ncbi:flagellar hook assembly protein FlgD [Kistimonas asteriae]|uniref:flagellar hook assembly protein FlgD n=1 Tax=Kistimonas asteriae TaxID=517724 RepID=UPI001BAA0600|nr:flagellar hook capping FlgD N-terminal domain-containing protein [Kistimonas asteriae]
MALDIPGLSGSSSSSGTTGVSAANSTSGMGQEEFMQMLLAEINNQDPLNPQSSSEFVGQLAQITSVENLSSLNSQITGLVSSLQYSQAMQATDLVGKTVTVPINIMELESSGTMTGEVQVPVSADRVQLYIQDASGQIVDSIDLGAQASGTVPFTTDSLAKGMYSISASATYGTEEQSIPIALSTKVDSVVIPGGGKEIELNLAGIGAMAVSQVSKIQE